MLIFPVIHCRISRQAAVSTHRVENKLRSAVKSRQVRVNEFFKDFDRLRNGFITRKSQSQRFASQSQTVWRVSRDSEGKRAFVCRRSISTMFEPTFSGDAERGRVAFVDCKI